MSKPPQDGDGAQPPAEPSRTLDDMLEDGIRDAIDKVKVIELKTWLQTLIGYAGKFGEQVAIAALIALLSFAVGLWWNAEAEPADTPADQPEVNIGVDPNSQAQAVE